MRIDKREWAEGIELSNQEFIRTLMAKWNYKYLGILEADTIKQGEEKEKKRLLQRIKKTSWNQTLLRKSYKRDEYLEEEL